MSRSGGDYEYDDNFPNEWAFWERRTRQVMSGKPMRKALVELREALLALPEKRLISNALSTVGKERDQIDPRRPWSERNDLLDEQGAGVCVVGAFAWYKRVKAGEDPQQALVDLPLAPDYDGDIHVTIEHGEQAGLSNTLAWILMGKNDETFGGMTPEERYEAYLAWIDERLAESVPA